MRYNVVFVGSVGGGKTSIIKKKLDNNINKHVSTIAVDFVSMKFDDFDVSVWDTCGQERFMSITSSYFARGHVFVLVHDIIDSEILNDLEKWRKEIVNKAPARHSPVIIVASNKIDLAAFCGDGVTEWVANNMFDHVYTSAKTGEGIDRLFETIKNAITVHQSDWLSPSLPALPEMPDPERSPGCAC
jgi:small GTP-binding protein